MRVNDISEKILKKAIGHIISMQEKNSAWSRLRGEFPSETEPTSWAVKVLSLGKMAPDKVEKGVRFILSDQQPNGSWNNNAAHTGFAITALCQTGMGIEVVKKAVSYLRNVQHREGGFQRTAGVGEPTTLHTAIVLFSMKEAGLSADDPMVKKAVTWLADCQNEDGGYGVARETPSVAFGTARAVKALRLCQKLLTDRCVSDGIKWLLAMQKESGGFAMAADQPEDPEITAYVLTAIYGLDAYKKHMGKAIEYLEQAQEPDGTFVSYAPIQFNGVGKKLPRRHVLWPGLSWRWRKKRTAGY